MGYRHPVEGKNFKILEFGGLNIEGIGGCIQFPILKNGVNFYTKCHKFRLLGAPGSVKIGSGAYLVNILNRRQTRLSLDN